MSVEPFVIRKGEADDGSEDVTWWRWSTDVTVFGCQLTVNGTARTEDGARESIEAARLSARDAQ